MAEKFISENRRYSVLAQRGHLLLHKGHFADAKAKYLDAYDLEPDEATWLIFAASAAFHLGDIEGAEQLARRATECSEGCIDEAWFNLGGYLLSQKRYEEARDCYRRALAIDPDYEIAKKRLSDVDKILLQPQSDSP